MIDQPRLRYMRPLVASVAALLTCVVCLLAAAGPARAGGEFNYCWGVTLAGGDGSDSYCSSNPKAALIQAVSGSGRDHSVCVGVQPYIPGAVTMCSPGPNQSVYNGSMFTTYGNEGPFSYPFIENNGGTANKVWGHAWWVDKGPGPPPPPPPTWHTGINLGGAALDAPDISSWGYGRLDIFVRGTNNALHHMYFVEGTGWTGWSNLGGPSLASGPGAVSWGKNRIDVVARATNGTVSHWWWNGTSWNSENLGGSIVGDPDISSFASGRLDIFARGTDNTLKHRYFANNTWSAWESLGGSLASGPGAVSWGNNRIDVVGRAPDNSVTHWWWEYGVGWQSNDNLGGLIIGDPDISSRGAGRLDVFATGTNNALHHKWYVNDGSGWSGWENLGGPSLTSGPGAVSWGSERIDVVGRLSNGTTQQWWYGR